MRSRTSLALAGLLVIALVAVIGVAAFSTGDPAPEAATLAPVTVAPTEPTVSARVASAVFALSVTPERGPEATAVTTSEAPPTVVETEEPPAAATEDAATATTAAAPATTTTGAAPRDTTPPPLTITSPQDGATVTDRIVRFEGRTEPGADVFSGPFEADVDDQGDWILALVVFPGDNGAAFTARDAAGNETDARIVVHYDPPATTTTVAPKTTTTTTGAAATTTTTAAPTSQWSPLWPADAGGRRNVENWRPVVDQYWAADRVDCVLGIIKRESGGDPTAHNARSNAEGLMQHLLKYWKGRAIGAGFVDGNGFVASPFNGEANIAAGAYLATWADRNSGKWWSPWSSLPDYGSCGA